MSAALGHRPTGVCLGAYLMITVRKITRSLTAAMPGWLLAISAVCLVIPLVRLAALLVVAVPCLIQPVRVRRASSAWKGGKSHRVFDGG
jgi:hypothetical protein